MITVPLNSEVILTGTFQLQGTGALGNLSEFLAPPFPTGGTIPASPFPHGNTLVNKLIHTDQPWEVKLNWVVGGILAHAIDPMFKWQIEILLEKWGSTEDATPAANRITSLYYGSGISSGSGPAQIKTYPGTSSTTVTVPGGIIPAGVYDVVAVLRLLEADGVTPCFLAAFAEFGKIDFYDGH